MRYACLLLSSCLTVDALAIIPEVSAQSTRGPMRARRFHAILLFATRPAISPVDGSAQRRITCYRRPEYMSPHLRHSPRPSSRSQTSLASSPHAPSALSFSTDSLFASRRRPLRHQRPIWQRQIDAAQPAHRYRSPDEREGRLRREGTAWTQRERAGALARTQCGRHLPVLPAHPDADGAGECPAGAGVGRWRWPAEKPVACARA